MDSTPLDHASFVGSYRGYLGMMDLMRRIFIWSFHVRWEQNRTEQKRNEMSGWLGGCHEFLGTER